MPHADPEKRKEYNRQYYLKNKEKLDKQNRKYYQENKDTQSVYQKQYREQNKEKISEYKKQYKKDNPKKTKISKWKQQGIISDDWDAVYERVMNTEYCELCNVKLTDGKIVGLCKTTRCLDHDHKTGQIRNVVCITCNVRRG